MKLIQFYLKKHHLEILTQNNQEWRAKPSH